MSLACLLIFRSVLHDSALTSYDKYVTCLTGALKEATVIAQDHAAKEQNRHAQLYNRKVKGSKIEIGDRVLLANRKERGKKRSLPIVGNQLSTLWWTWTLRLTHTGSVTQSLDKRRWSTETCWCCSISPCGRHMWDVWYCLIHVCYRTFSSRNRWWGTGGSDLVHTNHVQAECCLGQIQC